jgi:perosamine synthetase
MRSLSTFGINRWEKENSSTFDIPVFGAIGFNYKMSDLSAAVGIAQFKKLDKIIKKKNALARYWNKRLKEIDYINQPYIRKGKGNVHNYQGYCCLVTPVVDRNKLIQLLKDRGIQTQIGTYSSYIQPCYNNENDNCHTSYDIFNRAIRLPLFYKLKKEEIDYVINVLKEIRDKVFI